MRLIDRMPLNRESHHWRHYRCVLPGIMLTLAAFLCGCEFRIWHEPEGRGSGGACLLRPGISDVNLFRYCQGVIYFDA